MDNACDADSCSGTLHAIRPRPVSRHGKMGSKYEVRVGGQVSPFSGPGTVAEVV